MIYVIRHGQTDLNKERKMQGRLGLPINSTGIEQAERLRTELQFIKFDYIYSSPQERAIQTAETITGIPPVIEPRLDVFDLGEADGLSISEVKMAGPIPDTSVYRGVENTSDFLQRVFSFMKEVEVQHKRKEVNILLSGHRCTTGCIGAYINGVPTDGNILRYSSDNGNYHTYMFQLRG